MPHHPPASGTATGTSAAVVAHVIHSGGFFGAEKVLFDLAASSVGRPGFTVKLIAFLDPDQATNEISRRIESLGLEVVYFPCAGGIGPVVLWRYAALLRKHRISLVHTHGYKPAMFHAFSRLLRMHRVPTVATAHGFLRTSTRLKDRLYFRLEMFAYGRAESLIAVSDETARYIRAEKSGINLKTIRNGIDTRVALRKHGPLRKAMPGLREGQIIIGSIGRLVSVKNQRLLVDAVASLRDPRCRLAIIGDGPDREALTRFWREALPGSEPCLIPFQEDILEWLNDMDVFALPSLSEGMPMTVLEAGLLSKPVIASRVGGIPELIRHGENGLLFPSGDKAALAQGLKRLLDDPGEAARLGANLNALVRRDFDLQAVSRGYFDIYTEVLGKPA
jgi:glycosyltransferase involved in cell wall biosynthesis